ncbi:hypothetical protein ACQJBY_036072 [Aegilops geniculata]
MAEDLALRFGLNLAQSYGCSRLVINSDNIDVIQAMQEGGLFAGPAAAIIDDCYHMSHDLVIAQFEHCHREANSVAHELARLARFSPPSTWFDEAPSALLPLIVKDSLLVSSE